MEKLVEDIDNIILDIKGEKIKNTIKTEIINNLDYVKLFITSSPGLISPSIVGDKINTTRQYLKVWVKGNNIYSTCDTIFSEIESRFINLQDTEEDKEEDSVKIPEDYTSYTIPSRTKKLFSKDMEIRRGDVSYLPVGPCRHYCIVYKIIDDTCLVLPITTSGGYLGFGYDIEKSRFFKGTVLYSINQFPKSMVAEYFALPYDSVGEVRKIFKGFEEMMKSILPKPRKPYK